MNWNILWVYIKNQVGNKFYFGSYWVGEIRWNLNYDDGNFKKEIKAYRYDDLKLQGAFEEMYNWLLENKLIEKLPEMGAK